MMVRFNKALTAAMLAAAFFVSVSLAASDLDVAVDDSPDPVKLGNNLTFTIAVTNNGPNGATNVVVTDVLPASYSFVSCDVTQGSFTNEHGAVTATLGTLLNGATAGVTIVVSPGESGFITNTPTLTWDDESESERAPEVTEVLEANRAPTITLPTNTHTIAVGSSTGFVVTATDHDDHDVVTLANTVYPSGATFDGTNFAWTAGASFVGSTNLVEFVADDQQAETNSVVTNSTLIVVLYDSDLDGMDDGWEWTHFQSLTNLPSGDNDGDDLDNGSEYVANTQPTNSDSCFKVDDVTTTANPTNYFIEVRTEPSRTYSIEYFDGPPAGSATWVVFSNLADGVGTWAETSTVSTTYTFVDDIGPDTTGHEPPNGNRCYRIKVECP